MLTGRRLRRRRHPGRARVRADARARLEALPADHARVCALTGATVPQKDPQKRWLQAIGEARIAIDRAMAQPARRPGVAQRRAADSPRRVAPWRSPCARVAAAALGWASAATVEPARPAPTGRWRASQIRYSPAATLRVDTQPADCSRSPLTARTSRSSAEPRCYRAIARRRSRSTPIPGTEASRR